MATVTFSGILATNPGLEDVLDPSGTITAFTASTFEITNATGGTWNGFKFRFIGSGFAYSGTTPTDGTITGVTVLDASANIVATVSGPFSPFDDPLLADIWDTLQNGAGLLAALDQLFYFSSDTVTGTNGVDHLTSFGAIDSDFLSGGGGGDVLWARSNGFHTLVGGTGSDVFRIDASIDTIAGSAQDGSGGAGETDVILVGTSGEDTNVSFLSITNIDGLRFAAPVDDMTTNAIFAVDQVGAGLLSPTLAVEGSTSNATDRILFSFGQDPGVVDVDLSGWTFSNWTRANQIVSIVLLTPPDHHLVGTQVADQIGSGEGNDTLAGGGGNDQIVGGDGDDSISGGTGDDMILGGVGNDTADYSETTQGVVVNLSLDFFQATGAESGTDQLFGIENITGGSGSDALTGNAEANVLDGGAGADTLVGGLGDDTYVVNNASDTVTENSGEGTDTIRTTLSSFVLGANVENLVFTDGATHTGFGNALANIMAGGSGSDTLVAHTVAGLFAQEHDTLSGGDGSDTLYGEAADTLDGGPGFDVLQVINDFAMNLDLVAAGIEYVVSGFGNDTYTAATATVAIEVYGGGGNDQITSGSGNDNLWAGVGNDTLVGNGGNDLLVGDLGADSLSGGSGTDRLYIDNDDTFIDGGADFDAAYIATGTGISINLATTHIEWVADFAGGNDTIDGSGMSVNLEIYGEGGTDNVTGGSGNDIFWGGSGNDTLTGNGGNDTLVGGTGSDTLRGDAGTDALYANSGGGGDSVLDTLEFTDSWGTDFVFDFEHGIDKLDLSAVTGVNTFADLTLTDTPDGHCYVTFGGNLIAIAGMAGQITQSDFLL